MGSRFVVQAAEQPAHPKSAPRRRPGISSHRCTQIGEQPDYDGSGGNPFHVHLTDSNEEDTSALGWTIADVAHLRFETGSNTNWRENDTGRSIQITVRAANTPPTVTDTPAAPLTVTTNEDTDYPFSATDFNFLDANSNDELASVKIATLPTAGTLTLIDKAVEANDDVAANDIGNLKYTPVANANGTPYATFGFTVSDGLHDSASATMTINVTAVNDAPVVTGPMTLSVAENMASGMAVWDYTATDQENDSIEWSLGETDSSGVDDGNEFSIEPPVDAHRDRRRDAGQGHRRLHARRDHRHLYAHCGLPRRRHLHLHRGVTTSMPTSGCSREE